MVAPSTESKKSQKPLIFILLTMTFLLSGLVAYLIYDNLKKDDAISFIETKLSKTNHEKDSLAIALENEINELIQLQEKYNSLNEQNEDIRLLIDELNQDKLEWENRSNLTKNQIANLEKKLNKSMLEYDSKRLEMQREITELKQLALNLDEKNKNLIFSNDSLQAASQDQLLINKGILKKASKLKGENLRMEIKGKNDKVLSKAPFKESQIITISSVFNLSKNELAAKGSRILVMRIEKPDGGILYDVSANGNTFKTESNQEFYYTVSKEIDFKNKYDEVILTYNKQGEMSEGIYNVAVYIDGEELGRISFEVK